MREVDPNELPSDHPFYTQLSGLRGWADSEVARVGAGGERKLDREALRVVLDHPAFGGERWGIDLDAASDAELIGQIELADESMWFAALIRDSVEALEEGQLVELEFPAGFGPED